MRFFPVCLHTRVNLVGTTSLLKNNLLLKDKITLFELHKIERNNTIVFKRPKYTWAIFLPSLLRMPCLVDNMEKTIFVIK